jgi:hypothetical protein
LVRLFVCCSLVLGATVPLGCGGDDSEDKPTEVGEADLQKDGEFWNSLTPDLKDQLVEAGQDRLGKERPDGASEIDAIDTAQVVQEIDKQYTNEGKRGQKIYDTYVSANDTIARQQFEEVAPELEGGGYP